MEPENQNSANEQTENKEITKEEFINDETKGESKDENAEFKTFAVLGYILPFLFFLPLIDDNMKNAPFARFHANQQLIVLIALLGIQFVDELLFVSLGDLGTFFVGIARLIVLILIIYGAVNAYKGREKELPILGGFKILK